MTIESDRSPILGCYSISNKFFFSILGFLLIISSVFIYFHGEFVVSDGYIEYSRVLSHEIFLGPEPTVKDYQRAVYAHDRPLFPFCVSITAFFVTWGNLGLAGHLISAICGAIGLICFEKVLAQRNLDKNKRKGLVLIMASSPAFTVYWVKFSPEIMFLMFCFLSIYFYLKPRNKKLERSTLYYLLFLFLSLLTREIGVLLILLPIFSQITKIQDTTRRMYVLIASSFVLFITMLVGFIVVLQPDVSSVGWAYFFDKNVWVGYLSSGNINLADIKLENIPEFVFILIGRMISLSALINLIGPFLVIGPILITLFTLYNWRKIFNQALEEPVLIWGVFYFAIVWFIMVSTFNERFTLILLLPILLFYSSVLETPQVIPQRYSNYIDPLALIILLNIFLLSIRFLIQLF